MARHVPSPPGITWPVLWGTEERLAELLGDQVTGLRNERRSFVLRFRSPEEFVGFFRDNYGPTHKAFQALDEAGRRRLHDDLVALADRHDRSRGPSLAMASEYLETVAVRA